MNKKNKIIFFLSVAIAFFILMALGTWQIERLEWKENLLSTIASEREKPALLVTSARELHDFQPVKLRGEFLYAYEKFLTPRTRDGEKGVHHIVPFILSDGQSIILVNRGFIPDKAIESLKPVEGQIEISGYVRKATDKSLFTPDNKAGEKIIYWVDRNGLAIENEMPIDRILPVVFYQTSIHTGPVYPLPHADTIELPNNHFKYALFWFSMGFVMLVIAGIFYAKQRHDGTA